MTESSIYRTALQDCGFGDADIERGLQMLESGRYLGLGDIVASLSAFGGSRPAARQHQVDAVVRRVQHQETLAELDRRAARGQARSAERRAVREAEEAERRQLERAEDEARSYFVENVTDAEWNASEKAYAAAEAGAESPVRPEIARAFRRWKELTEALKGGGAAGGPGSGGLADEGLTRSAVEAFGGGSPRIVTGE